jgi:hypothetical protein
MLNNILNGYRPLIIKIGVISLLAFCISFVFSSLHAQEAKPEGAPGVPNYAEVPTKMICGATEDFLRGVKETAEEQIFGMGQSDETDEYILTFWTNYKTKTWTIALTDVKNPEFTCIVHTGKKLQIIMSGKYST